VPKTPSPQQLITIGAAAERLGLDDRTVRRYVADGKLPAYRVGAKLVRVNLPDVEALIRPIPAVGALEGAAAGR
jgi:excisionase family DNA binding protein